jgi:hypothetical protein
MLMGNANGVEPERDEVSRVAKALAWVLWALFACSEELGLKHMLSW